MMCDEEVFKLLEEQAVDVLFLALMPNLERLVFTGTHMENNTTGSN